MHLILKIEISGIFVKFVVTLKSDFKVALTVEMSAKGFGGGFVRKLSIQTNLLAVN